MIRALLVKQKLKLIDGIDVKKIRERDLELRDRINNQGQVMNQSPSLQFDYDSSSGNIKVRDDEPLYLKNERQREFIQKQKAAE